MFPIVHLFGICLQKHEERLNLQTKTSQAASRTKRGHFRSV